MTTMNGAGQKKLTDEERERLNQRETIAHDDPSALSTEAGWNARRNGFVPPSEGSVVDDAIDTAESDAVNHPIHYTSHPSGVECITIIEHMPHNVAAAVGYLWRHQEKGNPIRDLRKAEWHVRREIQRLTAMGVVEGDT